MSSQSAAEAHEYYRHYSTLRSALLPIFAFVTGGLATVEIQVWSANRNEIGASTVFWFSILGCGIACLFVLFEVRTYQLLKHYMTKIDSDLQQPQTDGWGATITVAIVLVYAATGIAWIVIPLSI